ncbi:MAG: CehA/McbA family metallohydrolase [Deltaproteobacteria bacterium]|nr:CehA/McbA family metallohydrolase [Deltaproteobacteria bacterium]
MTPSLLVLLLSCDTQAPTWARASVMTDLSQGIGGPKALAQPGDVVLENDRVRFVVMGGRTSIGPGLFGGTIIDADLQRADPTFSQGRGNDRFAELIPTVNMNVAMTDEPEEVVIVNDGSDGGPAIVRAVGESEPFISLLGGLWAIVGAPDFTIITEYELAPGDSYVTMRTTAFFGPQDTLPDSTTAVPGATGSLPLLTYALETGVAFGDFYLQGGHVDVFAPGMGFDEDGAVYAAEVEGRNTFHDPFVLDFIGGSAEGVSYALASLDGEMFVPLFTSSQTAGFGAGVEGDVDDSDRFPPLTALTYTRVFALGDGDIGSALEVVWTARQEAGVALSLGSVSGNVYDPRSLHPLSGVKVFAYAPGAETPTLEWTTDVSLDDHVDDGSFAGVLPVGDWELLVHEQGRPLNARLPITVRADSPLTLTLLAGRSGDVSFHIFDEQDMQVPAKVTILPADGGPVVRDPVLGDGYIAGDPEAIVFCPHGACEVRLPPGDYVAYATRGPEYELGIQSFTVRADQPAKIELTVVRSVDTTGFVSADFHVHSAPSHDSGVSLPDRVGTMVAEHVEFFISSDHDYISDFRPVIEDLGLEPFVATAVGLEVTPVELGHYLAFPVRRDPLAVAGGAFDWSGLEPDEILDELRALGDDSVEPVTFVAHPRDGILGYFDQYGFSPYGGTEGEPLLEAGTSALVNPLLNTKNFTMDFDALELLNGKRYEMIRTPTAEEIAAYAADEGAIDGYDVMVRSMDEQQALIDGVYTLGDGIHGQVDDWFTLLNLGYRFTALGNSDTHGKTSIEAGCPRNWVASPTDDPAYIRVEDIADAIRRGEVITSSGPFVRFSANGDTNIGGTVTGAGEVTFNIEVSSPTWFDVSRVELYRNGTLIEEWAIETPNADIVNLSTTFADTPDVDAWYVVIAMGESDLYPLFTPTDYPPVQLQDVVFEALSTVPAVGGLLSTLPPMPRSGPTYPYALTNPIWVDLDGDGFDAPGLPSWLVAPETPE